MDNLFKLKIVLIFLILFTSYFYFSNPSSLVVNENGKVKGIANNVRVFFQCEKFWKHQYKAAYRMNEQKNSSPTPPSEIYWSTLENSIDYQNINRELDSIYRVHFTSEQYRAQKLREEADRVEMEGNLRIMDEMYYETRAKEINESELALPHINKRLSIAKPWYITPILILILIISFVISIKYFNNK